MQERFWEIAYSMGMDIGMMYYARTAWPTVRGTHFVASTTEANAAADSQTLAVSVVEVIEKSTSEG